MKQFNQFIKENKVLKVSPDPSESRSLMQQAMERLSDLKQLPINERNASFRFESAYEAMREALQAFLAAEGFKPYSHESILSFAMEKRLLSEAKIMQADRFREIRNDINYRGKKVTMAEAKEAIKAASENLETLSVKLKRFF